MSRKRGEGSIDELPSGRFRVRVPDGQGGRIPLIRDTPEEAEQARLEALRQLATGEATPVRGMTLRQVGEQWISLKGLRRPRSVEAYEDVWRNHILGADFIDWPIASIDHPAVSSFITRLQRTRAKRRKKARHLSASRVRYIITILRMILKHGMKLKLIAENPAVDQELPRVPRRDADQEDDTWLDLDEQQKVLASNAIPEPDRLIIAFAIGTGLREGEQVWLELADLQRAARTGKLAVRWGSENMEPKNGPRTVSLVPFAIDVARRWLEILPAYCPDNPRRLAFPKRGGEPRRENQMLGSVRNRILPEVPQQQVIHKWRAYLRAAGIEKNVTWHGLRRTCASSLWSGLWGRSWSIQEVARYIGDTEEVTIKHYARMSRAKVVAAAQETTGGPFGQVTDRSRETGSGSESTAKQGHPVALSHPRGSSRSRPATASTLRSVRS